MSELATVSQLLDVETGEVLPANVENAATVLQAARNMKGRIQDVIAEATAFLVGEAAHRGTKTFNGAYGTVSLTGGTSVEYDAVDLMEALRIAGCPEDRIADAVTTEISYKVNRAVLRQLVAANPDYRAAVELAERSVEKPYRASIR